MEFRLSANICDTETYPISCALVEPSQAVSDLLRGNYGGVMEHLWIDIELRDVGAENQRNWPFRFQKRVSGRSPFGLPPIGDSFNVGHYSVRPELGVLLTLPTKDTVAHVLQAVYESTIVLNGKQKRLGDFDVDYFRRRFQEACLNIGHEVQ
ncbi:hypothetical protein ABT364_22560 [Massilia sp. SR12]